MTRLRTWAYWMAWLALLVNGPRYVLIYLAVDDLRLPPSAEGVMLAITGVATAVVLTGGNIAIAGMIVQTERPLLRIGLSIAWISQLAFAVALISPMLVIGIRAGSLSAVLAGRAQWIWSVLAVLAVEVIAGATMAGYVATGKRARGEDARSNRWVELAYRAAERAIGAEQRSPEPVQREDALASTESSGYECPQKCGFVGASPQAVAAHKRWCKRGGAKRGVSGV